MKNEKVVVTGAAGFIGGNLCAELLKRGYKVIGMDNLSQGTAVNVREFKSDKNFRFIKADVRDGKKILSASKGARYIVHLAAYKIPRYESAMNTLLVNALGTKNALDAAVKNKCKLVFASTSDVYGKNPELPFSEESNLVLGPSNVKRWAYASSKIFDEHMCFAYGMDKKLKFTIVRYFGSYGPKQNLTWWGGPQGVFAEAIFNNKKLPIHGDGKQTRCFSYISDTVEGTLRAMESEKANAEIFNIGGKEEISILRLAKLMHKISGSANPFNIEFVPYERFGKYEDVMRRVPNTSKAQRILGFKSEVPLSKGIKLFLKWYKRGKGIKE